MIKAVPCRMCGGVGAECACYKGLGELQSLLNQIQSTPRTPGDNAAKVDWSPGVGCKMQQPKTYYPIPNCDLEKVAQILNPKKSQLIKNTSDSPIIVKVGGAEVVLGPGQSVEVR